MCVVGSLNDRGELIIVYSILAIITSQSVSIQNEIESPSWLVEDNNEPCHIHIGHCHTRSRVSTCRSRDRTTTRLVNINGLLLPCAWSTTSSINPMAYK